MAPKYFLYLEGKKLQKLLDQFTDNKKFLKWLKGQCGIISNAGLRRRDRPSVVTRVAVTHGR